MSFLNFLFKSKNKQDSQRKSMKFPPRKIYWEHVTKYLELDDISRTEFALTNHELRKNLSFDHPYHLKYSLREDNPYITIPHHRNKDISINLHSENMVVWCELRGIILLNVKLGYQPFLRDVNIIPKQQNVNIKSTYDLLNYIEILSINTPFILVSELDREALFSRLHRFESWSSSRMSNEILHSMSHQLALNSKIGQHNLLTLHLTGDNFKADVLPSIFKYLPTIQNFRIVSRLIKDEHIKLMNEYWPNLKSLTLEDCRVTDVGLSLLKDGPIRFESVELRNLVLITHSGVSRALSNSSNSLAALTLTGCPILATEILDILKFCSNLKKLHYLYYANNVEVDIIRQVAVFCPLLTDLMFIFKSEISDHDVSVLVHNCPYLQYLSLGQCTGITVANLLLIAETYCDSLRQMSVEMHSDSKISPYIFRAAFRKCRHRVMLSYNNEAFFVNGNMNWQSEEIILK